MSKYPDIITVGGPTYGGILFPFTYSNGTIDLPSGWATGKTNSPANERALIRRLGSDSLIQYIGSNFKNYIFGITSFSGYKVSNTSSIKVVQPGIAIRVVQLGPQNLPTIDPDESFKVSESAPVAGFIQYPGTYVFGSPLVLSATATPLSPPGSSSRTIYITFFTHWYH